MGHLGQITLSVLGKPIEVGIECCLAPRHKGPCRKGGYGPKISGPHKPRAKKASAPKAAPKASPKAGEPGHRVAEVERIMSKPTHQGTPTSAIRHMFQDAAARPGWLWNPHAMTLTYNGTHGRAGVELVSGGFRAVGPANPNLRLPAIDKVYKDFHSAYEAARIHGGNPKPPRSPYSS